jgi:DNA-binding MarR family transcriptional regulator
MRAREVELARAGISLTEAGALYFLKSAKEPLTPAQLARLVHKEPHSVSGRLRRMEAEGLVKMTKNPKRKNQVLVSVTTKGEEAYKRQLSRKAVRNITSCLSKKELDTLNAICDKLYDRAIELLRDLEPYPYGPQLEQESHLHKIA